MKTQRIRRINTNKHSKMSTASLFDAYYETKAKLDQHFEEGDSIWKEYDLILRKYLIELVKRDEIKLT